MKNLITKTLIATLCTMAFANQASANTEQIRLVFSSKPSSNTAAFSESAEQNQTTQSASGCVTAADGATFCAKTINVSGVAAMVSSKESVAPSYRVETLDAQGHSAQDVADLFNRDGRFGLVEVDAVTSGKPVQMSDFAEYTAGSEAAGKVNDTYFAAYQENRYFGSWNKNRSGSDISPMWDLMGMPAVQNKSAPVDLLFVDSEFEVSKETPYDGGRSFTTTVLVPGGAPQLPNDDFSVRPEVDNVCDTHGMNVVAIASGKMNNGFGAAGVTNNVTTHALRSLTCGVGFLSDSANALLWAAGEPFQNSGLVSPYTGKPGIINMSMGAKTGSCPEFMQTAINAVRRKGFTVVVSAGNEGGSTATKSPANCSGVIVVGAVNEQGALSSFSNTGKEVSVLAQGEWMPVPCEDNDESDSPRWCFSSGTSMSTPVVSGVLAAVKQQTGASDATLKTALKLTSSPVTDARCTTGECGAGLINAAAVYAFGKAEKEGKLNFMTHALADKSKCDQEWLLDNFGHAAPICKMYKVTLFNNYSKAGDVFKLYSIAEGESFTSATPELVGEFTTNQFMMSDVQLKGRQYGVQLCRDGSCMADILPVNTSASGTPVSCQ